LEQGWGRSVKAQKFVFCLHDYFSENYMDTDPLQIFLSSGTPKGIEDFGHAQTLANQKAGDLEAVKYISLSNIQPIIEVI
jgi:hypothetical protein